MLNGSPEGLIFVDADVSIKEKCVAATWMEDFMRD